MILPLLLLPMAAMAQDASPAVRDWIGAHAVPIATVHAGSGFEDLQALKPLIGGARIVSLGEATHGTREFFQLKHRITEFLASEMGFTIFSIEANMPEAYRLNDYVLHGQGDPAALIKGMYFWTWDTEEVLEMVRWMRDFNASGKGRIQFTGFDMQTPNVAAKIVEDFVARQEPEYAGQVREGVRLALAPPLVVGTTGAAVGTFPVADAAGKHIQFSGYIRTVAVDGYAGLWWRADGTPSEGILAFENMFGRGSSGTVDWKRFEIELDIPAGVRNINFGTLLYGSGYAWFDGLEVKVDGETYTNEAVFAFLNKSTIYGRYQIAPDPTVRREGRPTLRIYGPPNAPGAVSPVVASAAWREIVDHLEAARVHYSGEEQETEWAIQNARVVEQSLRLRAGQADRDELMAVNIRWILGQNPDAKIILWAHNLHVALGSDAGLGFKPMGQWLKEWFKEQDGTGMVTFGFAFHQGSFQAIDANSYKLREFTVGPPPARALDAVLASVGLPLFALDLRQAAAGPGDVADWLQIRHPTRTIGSIYSDSAPLDYFTWLFPAKAFDVILFHESTTAARPNPPLQ